MRKANSNRQRGTTLIETLIATTICMVAVFSMAGLVAMSTRQSKEMGSTVAQATALASQKLDVELLALQFTHPSDVCSSTQLPPCIHSQLCPAPSVTCSTLPCRCGGLAINGPGFFDFLRADGTPATGPEWVFRRRWQVEAVTSTLRRISVLVEARPIGRPVLNIDTAPSLGGPSATVVAWKAQL